MKMKLMRLEDLVDLDDIIAGSYRTTVMYGECSGIVRSMICTNFKSTAIDIYEDTLYLEDYHIQGEDGWFYHLEWFDLTDEDTMSNMLYLLSKDK